MQSFLNRAALKASGVSDPAAMLCEAGRDGIFVLRNGTAPADPLEVLFVVSDTPGYYWERNYSGAIDVKWSGVKNDYSADAAPGIQACLELAYLLGAGIGEGPKGSIYASPGLYKLDSSIKLHKTIKFHVDGFLYYTPSTGSAVIVSDIFTTDHQWYDVKIGGVRAMNGNAALPTGVNNSGCSGLEIRRAQQGRFEVGFAIGFTKHGVWLNSTNNVYTGQHIQGNRVSVGYAAYNGSGFIMESFSAADGAAQANEISILNSFANFRNLEFGKTGDINCNHNIVRVPAMDDCAPGGTGCRIFGYDNDIEIGYLGGAGGSVACMSGSAYNKLTFLREKSAVVYSNAGTKNKAFFADQTTTP